MGFARIYFVCHEKQQWDEQNYFELVVDMIGKYYIRTITNLWQMYEMQRNEHLSNK